MGDVAVERSELEGSLYVWHYSRQRKGDGGWNFSADVRACQSIVNLINLIFDSPWKEKKLIPVTIPGKLRENQAFVSALLLRYPKNEAEENFWNTELTEGNVLILTLG